MTAKKKVRARVSIFYPVMQAKRREKNDKKDTLSASQAFSFLYRKKRMKPSGKKLTNASASALIAARD